MDKETLAFVDDIRKALIEYGEQVKSASVKKKTRKVTSELIWSPQPYLDELDNIRRTSKTDEEMVDRARSLIRGGEQGGIEDMRLMPDDTPHHMVQTRTGGDDLTKLDYRRTGPIIERLSEKHQRKFGSTTGPGGNLTAELSLSNASHKFDDRATGLERESGIGKAIPKAETAHPGGTAGHANLKGVDLSSDAAVEAALDKSVTEQIQTAQTAIKSDAPRQEAIKQLVPGAYSGTAADVAKARAGVYSKLITDKNAILAAYRALSRVPGGRSAFAAIPFIGDAFGAADAAEREVKAAKTGNPVDEIQSQLAGAGQIPVLGAVPDLANSVIDMFRAGYHHRKIRGPSGAQKRR